MAMGAVSPAIGTSILKLIKVVVTTLCPQQVHKQIGEQASVLPSCLPCSTLLITFCVKSRALNSSLHGNAESNTTKIK